MKTTHAILVSVFLAAVGPVALQAQQQRDRFKEWDTNSDSKLTSDELPDNARKSFKRMDTDRDDTVTKSEFDEFLKTRLRGRKERASDEDASSSPLSNATDTSLDESKRPQVTVPIVSEQTSPIEELRINETSYAALRKPPGVGPFPAVIFLHGGLGQSSMEKLAADMHNQATQARFLAWGYVVVNATRRKINHDPQDRGVVDDTVAMVRAVKKLPEVDPQSVVLYGGSGGGTLAIEVAGETELAAVVAGEPATIIYMGMFTKEHIVTNARGKPTGDRRWDVMKADAKTLYTPELRQRTRDKLAKINCPVLILHGDQHALKNFNLDVFVPEMKAMDKSVELIMYPGENHGFYWGRGNDLAMPLKANRDADKFFQAHIKTQPKPIDAELIKHRPAKRRSQA